MNTFLRRLKYYGIGFGIGLLFVFFIFKQKGCSWTPGNRVKEAVLNRIIVADSLDLAFLKGQKISAAGVRTLVQNSSISFSESAIKGDRKTYVLFGELPNGKSLKYLITLHDQDFMVEVDFLHSNPAAFQRTLREGKPLVYKPQKNWLTRTDSFCAARTYSSAPGITVARRSATQPAHATGSKPLPSRICLAANALLSSTVSSTSRTTASGFFASSASALCSRHAVHAASAIARGSASSAAR